MTKSFKFHVFKVSSLEFLKMSSSKSFVEDRFDPRLRGDDRALGDDKMSSSKSFIEDQSDPRLRGDDRALGSDRALGDDRALGYDKIQWHDRLRGDNKVRLNGKRVLAFIFAIFFIFSGAARAADSFKEKFSSGVDGSTINGVNSWSVTAGGTSNAMVVSGNSFAGGKSLEIVGSITPVEVSRAAVYGNLSPAWVEWVLKPGIGNQASDVPADGIAAVSFNYTGEIMLSDGRNWVKSGKTFDTDTWYRVLLKVDFTTHRYSAYISPANSPKIPFTPDKENLAFIDPSVNSLSDIGFSGVYNEAKEDNTFIDQIKVNFIQKLQIITPPQNLVKGRPSALITLQLQNANSEPQTALEDSVIELHSSSAGGEFSLTSTPWVPVSEVTIPEGAQQATFFYKDSVAGKPSISANEYPDKGWDEATQQETVVASVMSFDVSAASPQIAGQFFSVDITAKDNEGNPDKTYDGQVSLSARYVSPASGARQISPDSVSAFKDGVAKATISYADCGLIEIVAQDKQDSSKVGNSPQILFVPAQFAVNVDSTAYKVSAPFSVSVSALTADGQPAPNYQGPAELTPLAIAPAQASAGSLTPSSLGAGTFLNGIAQFSASYSRWGSISIEAHDASNPDKKGVSAPLSFSPAAISLKLSSPAPRNYYYIGENIESVLSVLDARNVPIPNFQGHVLMSSTPQTDIPGDINFTDSNGGRYVFNWSIRNPGSYILRAESQENNLAAPNQQIQVKEASIEVISTTSPIGKTEVQVQLLDDTGKRITSENNLGLTITFDESNPNGSAFLSDPGKPILFQKGLARFVLGDVEGETVTISAKSSLGLKTKNGTVTFGKVGKSGLGTQLYVEAKD